MTENTVMDAMRAVNREPLRDFEFLSFDELMDRLPETMSREAIRKLEKERGLVPHKIGKTKFYYVRDIITASAVGADDQEE